MLAGSLLAILAAVGVRLSLHSDARPDNVWWTPPFQAEHKAIDWHLSDDCLYFLPGDFSGQFYAFENGFRRTVGQPEHYDHTLWMLGNSTLAGTGVRDSETIASYLQALLPAYRVVNAGMPSAAAIHEYYRLRTLPVRAGDLVIFYDGQIDVELRWQHSDSVAAIARAYRVALAQAEAFTRPRGATFWHFLQPHAYTLPLRPWEGDTAQIAALYAEGWPALQASETGVDLTHVLDQARREGTVYYLDGHHINAAGNRIIARAIADYLTIY